MSQDIKPITMPKWGLAMSEGLVTAWHIEVGSIVEKGDPALDIETEKITNEFLSPASGVLRRQLVDVGDTVPVGGLLGVIADAQTSEQQIDDYVQQFNDQFAETLAARVEEAEFGPQPEHVDVKGHRMRYLQMGASDSAPLLLLHGFGGDLNNWLFNHPILAERHHVLALDLPGHGGTSKAMDVADVAGLANSAADFLDALEIPSAHLVGHSLGGAIAAELALSSPQRAQSLTLIASAGFGPDINMDYISGFIGATRRKDLKPVVEQLFVDPALVTRELLDDLLKFKRLDGVQSLLQRLADTVFAQGRQTRLVGDELNKLDVPIQLLWGAKDQIIPSAHAQALSQSYQVTIFEDAGHMVHMEKAAEVNDLISALITR